MTACPFCSITIERIVAQTERAFVIRDAFPISPGHSLIIPKRHIGSFFDTTEQEQTDILALLRSARDDLLREFNPGGFNIGINDGPIAGQTVPHLHVHLVPRFEGDVDDPRGGVRWIIPDRADYWSTYAD
jgi:diadenosine tetraphosphate (Ap4A) HIT family hydrolase